MSVALRAGHLNVKKSVVVSGSAVYGTKGADNDLLVNGGEATSLDGAACAADARKVSWLLHLRVRWLACWFL